ncbi:PKD domain-containing protein [Alkalitalea saponilacus]|uniref:Por secretion system C-terminal sorting domain-containing protein n=1 Tax=Alkalitalea saponilacus TaxID=889453 RepID=A0A1T5BUW9_9BACT|nr:PKD domain-containing protein [Alkalitalea saponilacus]ASB49590.1 hypothetical protein CDL62_10775 [Alkalitalea saponilacus]SKB50879.1 Por secretion system C-terminal sorting domain-containing protein [Alkalitalea saponilacus]
MKKHLLFISIIFMLCIKMTGQNTLIVPSQNYPTIQSAIDNADHQDLILVSPGTYSEEIIISSKTLTLASQYLTENNPEHISNTILTPFIEDEITKRIIHISGNSNVTLVGFTIKDGSVADHGAGLYVAGGTFKGEHLRFLNNEAGGMNRNGGAIYLSNTNAVISHSYFEGNRTSSSSDGGAIYSNQTNERNVVIDNCTFKNNSASRGGAIYAYSSQMGANVTIDNNIFSGNHANRGGAMAFWHFSPRITYNQLYSNSAATEGAALHFANTRGARVINNTIVKNQLTQHGATRKGAAIFIGGNSSHTFPSTTIITNNIIRNNAVVESDKEIYVNQQNSTSHQVNIEYCNISANADDFASANETSVINFGEGNITDDPLFVNFNGNDFNLQENSTCIDAGDPDTNRDGITWQNDPEDQDPDGTRKDIGAIYFHQEIEEPLVADFSFIIRGGYAPVEVTFNDESYAIGVDAPTSWQWDFNNDGTVNSTEQHPTYTYTQSGVYMVKLTVSNGTLSETVVKTEIIEVLQFESELEVLHFDFSEFTSEQNLCETPFIHQGVSFSGASSTDDNCEISINGGVSLIGTNDLFIADFSQLDGHVYEVVIEFLDYCGDNCTGGKAWSGDESIHTQAYPGSSSSNVHTFTFMGDEDNPIDLFHFFGMESVLLNMTIKKEKTPNNCPPTATIAVEPLSCNEFMITSAIEANGVEHSRKWLLNDVEINENILESLLLEPGIYTLKLMLTSNDNPECTYTATEAITVDNPQIEIETLLDKTTLELSYSATVEGIESFSVSWDFGDGNTNNDNQISGTHTYSEMGDYTLSLTIFDLNNNVCSYLLEEQIDVNDCMLEAEIFIYGQSCNEFIISEMVNNSEKPYSIFWFVNDVEYDSEDISPLLLEQGTHTIKLIVVDDNNESCTITITETILVADPVITVNTITNPESLTLDFALLVDGIDDYNFSWYFGDSGQGSGDEYRESGRYTYADYGDYTIALMVSPSDNSMCAYHRNIDISIEESENDECENGEITGTVHAELAALLNGSITMELYFRNVEEKYNLLTTAPISSSGDFEFRNLEPGLYIVAASINNPELYPEMVVSYFRMYAEEAFYWQETSPIVIYCDAKAHLALNMITLDDILSGMGEISGYLFYSNNVEDEDDEIGVGPRSISYPAKTLKSNTGYTLASGIRVQLREYESGKLLATTVSDENGFYKFSNLPDGEYAVVLDIVGKPFASVHQIIIDADNTKAEHRHYAISSTKTHKSNALSLTINTTGMGSVEVNGLEYQSPLIFDEPTHVTINATPDESWSFTEWKGDFSDSDASLQFTLDSNVSLEAIFEVSSNIAEHQTSANLFPNPFKDKLSIKTNNTKYLKVINSVGTIIETIMVDSETININTSQYPTGVYLIYMIQSDNTSKTIKAVKR